MQAPPDDIEMQRCLSDDDVSGNNEPNGTAATLKIPEPWKPKLVSTLVYPTHRSSHLALL